MEGDCLGVEVFICGCDCTTTDGLRFFLSGGAATDADADGVVNLFCDLCGVGGERKARLANAADCRRALFSDSRSR